MKLSVIVWKGEAKAEHNCTMECLLLRQNSRVSGRQIMHAVDDHKVNKLNDFDFDYSCGTFGSS